MELKDVMETRRSIRHYNDKEVPLEVIQDILNCGILAPSAHNRQPWSFIIVEQDKELKKKIAYLLKEGTDVTVNLTSKVIEECSALILVYGDITDELFDIQSIGACIQNMCLRATDLGLGSLWIGYILRIENQLKEIFKTDKKLVAALALGYTDKIPGKRPRVELKDISMWY